MAKKSFLERNFKEIKKDRKKELQNVYKKFLCDHKITEKREEVSLLKPTDPDDDKRPRFKCENCKKKIPADIKSVSDIKNLTKEVNGIIEVIKASIPNMTEELITEIADHQMFIYMIAEMYQVNFLNKNGHADGDDDSSDEFGGNNETMYFNSGRDDDTFGFGKKKDHKNHYKKDHKNNNNKKNHNGKKKKHSSSIHSFY